jgi:Tol biopolymer transport system component
VWAPDSTHLAVSGPNGIEVYDGRAGTVKRVCGHDCGDPSFSPDSHQLAYEVLSIHSVPSSEGNKRVPFDDLYVTDLENGRTRQITHDHHSEGAVWGSSGIAYFGGARNTAIWLTDSVGKRARRLTHTREGLIPVSWSADGERLLAESPAMDNDRIWAVDVPSGSAHALTSWIGSLDALSLNRDGSSVLAGQGCIDMGTVGIIETIPFAGGSPRVIVRGPCRASWNR